ncbi:UNVERIFIED_CONTAM: hypothetical protein Sindi_1354600 [Sesamum indicum]
MFASSNSIIKFNGFNYAEWSEQIHFQLGVMNLDLAIVIEGKSKAIADTSTAAEKSYFEAWEKSNQLGLNLMRMTIAESTKPSMPKTDNAREFLMKIKEYSQSDITDKSIVGSLMSELTTKRFNWSCSIHDHVIEMSNLAAKLKALEMDVNDSFLVQFIINSLPTEFSQFQVNYNTIKEK